MLTPYHRLPEVMLPQFWAAHIIVWEAFLAGKNSSFSRKKKKIYLWCFQWKNKTKVIINNISNYDVKIRILYHFFTFLFFFFLRKMVLSFRFILDGGYPILLVCRKLLLEHINNKTSLFYPLKARRRLLDVFYTWLKLGVLGRVCRSDRMKNASSS